MNDAQVAVESSAALIGQAANEFFEAIARGERPAISEFANRYPDIAEHICRTFPALLVIADATSEDAINGALLDVGRSHTLGDFRLIREIGSGGMGTVFEAEQLSMGRRVAIKVLPFAALAHETSLQRFRNEVRAAAALDHPHIVSVYSFGEERGVHYYAMQFIRGQTLADAIAALGGHAPATKTHQGDRAAAVASARIPGAPIQGSSVDATPDVQARLSTLIDLDAREHFRQAAQLGIQAAAALQHAHDQGVVHRDIKPSNLLLDRDGQLYIADFGLARIQADASLTITGDMIGTLRYMAPEQALAQSVVIDHRADIYSLGATLYEFVGLRPAFGEADRSQLLKQIAQDEPLRLRQIDRRTPIELETIVIKAMAKQPGDRYQTARQLAADLQAYLDNRPIKAKPDSLGSRLRKWSRRHETLVRTLAVASLLMSIGLALGIALIERAHQATVAALDRTSDLLYEADMGAAYQALEKGWLDEAQRLLNRQIPKGREKDRRGFEWTFLRKLVEPPVSYSLAAHQGSVNEIAVFPDKQRLASVGNDGTLRIWDLQARRLLKTIVVATEPLFSVAVSRDGRYVAAGSSSVYLCEIAASDDVAEIYHGDNCVESLAFDSAGQTLVAGTHYNGVYLLSLDGEVLKTIPCTSRVESLEYVADEPWLLVPNRRPLKDSKEIGFIQIWDDQLTQVQQELDASLPDHAGAITLARSSPSGRFVAAGERYRSTAFLFDRASGRIVGQTPASRDRMNDLAYSPDGKSLALAYENGCLECFRLQSEEDGSQSIKGRALVMDAHVGQATCVRYINGQSLASCGADGLIRIWSVQAEGARTLDVTDSILNRLQISPDGGRLIYQSWGEALFVDADRGDIVARRGRPSDRISASVWSPSGEKFALYFANAATLEILNRNGDVLTSFSLADRPHDFAFSPDESHLAIVNGATLELRRVSDGRLIRKRNLQNIGEHVAFSHDGRRLACGERFGGAIILDASKLDAICKLPCDSSVDCIAFSNDDSKIATGHGDCTIRLWDGRTGRLCAELVGHERDSNEVVFSPDGRTLLSSAGDNTVRIWSVATGRELGIVHQRRSHASSIFGSHVSLSADGRTMAIGYHSRPDGEPVVFLWTL